MYKDAYNAKVVAKQQANVRSHATNIDRLNGSGKAKGGAYCTMDVNPVTDPETGKTYDNKCKMMAAKKKPREQANWLGFGSCCARCKNCKCGRGMTGGAADTPIAAREWYKAQDKDFEDQMRGTITSPAVREERMSRDLGSGRGFGRAGNKLGNFLKKAGPLANLASEAFLPEDSKLRKGIAVGETARQLVQGQGRVRGGYGNVTPQGLTPHNVAMMRMNKDLGAGKCRGGAREEEDEDDYDDEELEGGAADYDDDGEDYEDGDDCGEMEGGNNDDGEPETLREMKSICDDYEQKKLTGGAMTKRIRAMLPHGKKGMSVSLAKLLRKLKKRGRESYARRIKAGLSVPVIPGQSEDKTSPAPRGSGRYVGGAKDYDDIGRIHDSVFGGSKLTGGYGPVAPTTEALAGYDNRDQPRGLKPPGSVNQQPGMRGGALPLHKSEPLAKKSRPMAMGEGMNFGKIPSGRGSTGGRLLIPEAQLPSKIGGGRFSKQGDYIGPSTGAIIPELQSSAAPAGSGKASRGAMVAKLMREKGMTLGQASKALKGGAYTANDFFMPKNIHQFFGAYA